MWYATVNFDLGPSITMEKFVASLPISSILNDYPAPSKVIAYLYTYNRPLLEKFDLDFGGELVFQLLTRCPLPSDIPRKNTLPLKDDYHEGAKTKPPPATFKKKELSPQRIEELGKFIQ